MIDRIIEKIIPDKYGKGKAVIILGARQTGKTTMLKILYHTTRKKHYF